MKKREQWKENVVSALEISRDLAYGDAIVTVTGPGCAVVENYRSILKYTREEILILTAKGKVKICGKYLEISCYTSNEMYIKGMICGVFFERS